MNRGIESARESTTVGHGETGGLRVCLVAGQFPPTIGGEERHAKLLGTALVGCGHEVCVLTQSIVGEPSEETLEGVRVVRAIRFLRRRPLIGLSYAVSVALFLLRTRRGFDIVQTTYLYWETVVAALLKPVLNGRLVVRIVIPGVGGDIAWFRALRLWPLPEGWRQRMLDSFTALVVRRADAFITLTTRGREELIGLGAPPARCHVVSNGIESARFESVTRSPGSGGMPQLLCVARLTRQKGLDVLLRALPILQAAVGRVAVTILGEGPEEKDLAVLAGQLGVADMVLFRGAVSDVTPYLAATDVFVFPSRYEGLPLALLEAMAAGLPVVASAVPGNTDLVRDGVEGLLIPPDDPGALAIAIARVLQEPGLAARLGAAGRSLVVSRYDVKAMVDQTIRAYRRTLEPRM